ncbi:U2 snRNP-associated SURP domain-containing protein [Borealophlyctis nickersoniae]|nr:U2 snRNP-associated SURP domain-containing protein [Borealophlyctis nickersoniae]
MPKPDNSKLPWGLSQVQAGTVKKINPTKLQAFTVGTHKKTPFQKQKEAEEAKKKKEDEEAARVYADFVASFDQDDSKSKTWVKGSTLVPTALYDKEDEARKSTSSSASALYKPQQRFVPAESRKGPGPERGVQPVTKKEESGDTNVASKGAKKRNLDAFLEELKRDQEERDHRLRSKHLRTATGGETSSLTLKAAFETNAGSHDTGDPDTTNLYVGNISPDLDEDMLCREFAVFGPIASVKIMWPRTQEEKDRKRNCGFVSFMTREAAVDALKALDGKEILGYVMRVGWGKAVAIPPKPIFELGTGRQPKKSGLPFNARPPVIGLPDSRPLVDVVIPSDPEIAAIIHRTVERVTVHGPAFESIIMDRERNNSKFRFLFDNNSEEHVYYRWKLYSVLQGDPKDRWQTEAFQMFDDGMQWIPPEVPFVDEMNSGESDESSETDESDSEVERPRRPQTNKGTLLRDDRLRLERKLRKLNLDRAPIADLMMFCIDRADAAEDIVDTIARSLVIRNTPIFPIKMARLYLVSDLLHNSSASVPNAWKYRSSLERRLGPVFAHLGSVWQGIPARLRAEQMRKAVMGVLTVWEGWNVFPREFTDGLRARFMEAKKAAEDTAEKSENGKEGEEGGDDNVDGMPLQAKKVTAAVESKWDKDESDEDEDVDGVPLQLADSAPANDARSAAAGSGMDDATRKKVHGIEEEVVRFMDELEAKGVPPAERDRQGGELRAKLLADMARGGESAEAPGREAKGNGNGSGEASRRSGSGSGSGDPMDEDIDDIFA